MPRRLKIAYDTRYDVLVANQTTAEDVMISVPPEKDIEGTMTTLVGFSNDVQVSTITGVPLRL